MITIIKLLLSAGLFSVICFISLVIGKCLITYWIFKNPQISDEKVKFVTEMMSKDIILKR